MIACHPLKEPYAFAMIHRPTNRAFEAFRDEEDVESEVESIFFWMLCAVLVFVGIVPPIQTAVKSSGLK